MTRQLRAQHNYPSVGQIVTYIGSDESKWGQHRIAVSVPTFVGFLFLLTPLSTETITDYVSIDSLEW